MEPKENIFRKWLDKQLRDSGWSRRELAKKSDISHAHISNVINGEKKVTFDFVYKVAKALDEPVWRLFEMAGLVSPPNDVKQDEETKIIVDAYKQMPERHRREIFEYVKWYTERHKKD